MRILSALMGLVLLSLVGCASTKANSQFDSPTPLQGTTVVLMMQYNERFEEVAQDMELRLVSRMGVQQVTVLPFVRDELSLNDTAVVDFARDKNASYIMALNLSSGTLYNNALSKLISDASLFQTKDKKPVWKGKVVFTNSMPTVGSFRLAAEKSADQFLTTLTKDGFLTADTPAK